MLRPCCRPLQRRSHIAAMASSNRVLYWGSGSTPCWRVQIALAEKDLPYESKLMQFSKSAPCPPLASSHSVRQTRRHLARPCRDRSRCDLCRSTSSCLDHTAKHSLSVESSRMMSSTAATLRIACVP